MSIFFVTHVVVAVLVFGFGLSSRRSSRILVAVRRRERARRRSDSGALRVGTAPGPVLRSTAFDETGLPRTLRDLWFGTS